MSPSRRFWTAVLLLGAALLAWEGCDSVTPEEGGAMVSGLRIQDCPEAEGGLPGGWRLTFQHLERNLPTATPTRQ